MILIGIQTTVMVSISALVFAKVILLQVISASDIDITSFQQSPARTRKNNIVRPKSYVSKGQRRASPIARVPSVKSKPISLDKSRPLPCCKDESGGAICRAMKANDAKAFANKCMTEPDFSLVVCCKACDEIGSNYRERASNFFSVANNGTNCFDRMSEAYCSRFQTSSDAWSTKRWSCHAEHYRLGFRVCRATCGFCQLDWKEAPEPTKCN